MKCWWCLAGFDGWHLLLCSCRLILWLLRVWWCLLLKPYSEIDKEIVYMCINKLMFCNDQAWLLFVIKVFRPLLFWFCSLGLFSLRPESITIIYIYSYTYFSVVDSNELSSNVFLYHIYNLNYPACIQASSQI